MSHKMSTTQNARIRPARKMRARVAAIAVMATIFAAGVATGRSTARVQTRPDDDKDEAFALVASAEITERTDRPTVTETDIVSTSMVNNRVEDSTEDNPEPYYRLTEDERDLVERVVMAEAGGEGYDGQRLVAQCILNAALLDGIRPDEVISVYQYTTARPEPSDSVQDAVSAVFDDHDVVVDEPILFFYAPAICTSAWHESQDFILERGGHRFFAPTG